MCVCVFSPQNLPGKRDMNVCNDISWQEVDTREEKETNS